MNHPDQLEQYIEALIFASQQALSVKEISDAIKGTFEYKISSDDLDNYINLITAKYEQEAFAIQLMPIAGGFVFMSKPQYHKIIGDYLRQNERKKLSKAALETLAIIAYKQPITKSEMEAIRGVGCDYTVQKLLEKELVEISGRHEGPGRPLLYGTTVKFLNHFGIKDTTELPKLKEFETVENAIGSEPAISE
jgi:segregation and condensation protein B